MQLDPTMQSPRKDIIIRLTTCADFSSTLLRDSPRGPPPSFRPALADDAGFRYTTISLGAAGSPRGAVLDAPGRTVRFLQETFVAKEEPIRVEGRIVEALPNTQFMVAFEEGPLRGHKVLAHIAGKMRKNFIRIVPGDR